MSESELRQRIALLEQEMAELKRDRDEAKTDRARLARNLSSTHDYLLELLKQIDSSKLNLGDNDDN